jgi:hypothetical protein
MEDKNEFTDAVKRYFETKNRFSDFGTSLTIRVPNEGGDKIDDVVAYDFAPGGFMNKWLRLFKIGDHISLEMDKNGLGLLLKVYRNESDKKGILLADMGYGITQLFSILLSIEEMIMNGLYKHYKNKGYFNHLLVQKFQKTNITPQTVAIEEPEIHLHPKYQSLLAEMFVEAYKEYNIQFIVETHSEYLLRKIQTLIGAKELKPDDVSMVYVEDDEDVKEGTPKVRGIPILEDGRLAEPFGPGFYDEAGTLSRELLKIKIDQKQEN